MKKVANGVTTHFHYDLSGQLIAETDGSGNPLRKYVYLEGEPVAMHAYGCNAGWYWFVNDHLGTPQKLVDDAGSGSRRSRKTSLKIRLFCLLFSQSDDHPKP